MALQLFGRKKCQETRKAERWLKERSVAYHSVDLGEKAMSKGELDSVARAVGSYGALLDPDCPRYLERGLAHMDFDPAEELLADQALLRTPILRDGPKALSGFDPKAWEAFFRK
jgi:arsenate reductase (glutaredoxin)